jgi:succinate dehydrogenase / fumarate reductase membrane anchor subunit
MRESRWWMLSLGAAALMIVLLTLHMGLMHLGGLLKALGADPGDVRSFAAVMERGRDLGQMVFYLLFLGAALYHGMYGLRSVLLEIIPPRGLPLLTGLTAALGLAAFAYGAYVTVRSFVG